MKITAGILLLLPLLACRLHAADAETKTLMTERGKLLFSDDLNKVTKDWRSAKGKWEIVDGALKGSELKADMHGAVTRHLMAFQDVVVQYEVKLAGCRQTTFSVNDDKEHLCRVLINKDGFIVQKDDHDHDGPDKAVIFGKHSTAIKPGEWHTVLIEIRGNEMLASLDGQSVEFGAHDLIGSKKANFGFTVAGESVFFKNLRVWEALPNKNWEKNKQQLAAARKKS